MQDTKLPDIPTGTLFQFSFNVDKYGKITNVQTGANPANYTPYAIQYIAPVIRSYQGRSILNFPEGTARTSTQVTGKWRISKYKAQITKGKYYCCNGNSRPQLMVVDLQLEYSSCDTNLHIVSPGKHKGVYSHQN